MKYILFLWGAFVILNPLVTKKYYKFYLFALACGLSFLAYHTEPNPSMDLYRYYNVMDLYREVGWDWVVHNDMDSNPLASIILYTVSMLNNNSLLPAFSIFIVYSCSFGLLYKASVRFSATRAEMNIALLFFMLNFNYLYAIDVFRMYLCYAVMAYFLYMDVVEKKHRPLCFIMYGLLCYVHYAMIVFVLIRILFIALRQFRGVLSAISVALFPAVLALALYVAEMLTGQNGILEVINKKIIGYQDYNVFGIWQFGASIGRLLLCLALCVLLFLLYTSAKNDCKKYWRTENGEAYILKLQSDRLVYDYAMLIVYFSMSVVAFISNYQFVLRTPYFIQILITPVLLYLLSNFRAKKSKYYTAVTLICIIESLGHFAYLCLYVYNTAVFAF